MTTFSATKLDQLFEDLQTRTGRRWSIREVAKATHISSTYLTLLKNGNRKNPSMDIVMKLSHFFQVTPEELLEMEQLPMVDQSELVADCTMGSLSLPQMRQTLELCEQLIASNNPRQALDLLHVLMPSASCCPSHELWFEIQLMTHKAMIALGHETECHNMIQEYLEDQSFSNNHGQLYYIRARLHFHNGQFNGSISDFLRAVSHAEKQGDFQLLYRAHYALGICYKETGVYATALNHFALATDYFSDQFTSVQKAHLYMGIGLTHLKMENLEEALHYFSMAESIYEEAGETKFLADLRHNLALVRRYTDETEQAIQQLQACLQIHQSVCDQFGIASDLWEIALCYKQMQAWNLVQEYALRASITFENINRAGIAARVKLLLIEARMQLGESIVPLVDLTENVADVFQKLAWGIDHAKALRMKAELAMQLGENEQALELSLQAFDLYQTAAGQ